LKKIQPKHVFYIRGFVGVLLCVILMTSPLAITRGASETPNTTGTSTSLQYTVPFTAPTFSSKFAQASEYTLVTIPGCIGLGKAAGVPAVPEKFITLLLPAQTTVADLSVQGGVPVKLDTSALDLVAKPILPYQHPVPIGTTETQPFDMNTQIYASDTQYPASLHSDYQIGYSHGYALLSFAVYPLQYQPASGTLLFYPTLTITVNLQKTGSMNQFFQSTSVDEAYVKTLVSNPEITGTYKVNPPAPLDYPGGLCDPSQHFDYVIITTTHNGLDGWTTSNSTPYNWDSLIAAKASQGLSATVVTVQDINSCTEYQNSDPLFNDQPAHIREFCKDAYEDWGTRYVLIAADADQIAARQLYYDYEGGVDSDLYWSNLDLNFNADHDSQWGESGDSGFDLYSEIFIGRITCDVPQDASNWMSKNFAYANSADWDYLENAGFYGGDTTWNCQGDDFIDYSAIKGTTDWLGPVPDANGPMPSWVGFQYGFETWDLVNPGNMYNLSVKWTAEPPNAGWSGGSTSAAIAGLKNAINNDQVTLLSGIAHANEQMSLDVYDSEWASQYHNTMPFFITDYGCHCGDFDAADDGVVDTMLFNTDHTLAFACVYNTGYGWGQFDNTNSSSAFQQKQFWNFFFNEENYSQDLSNWQAGRGHAWSKDSMAPTIDWDYGSGTWRGVIECCLLFGDPAQMIRTAHPSEPPVTPGKPSGQTQGVINYPFSFTATTTDPEGDDVYYLFDWGDGSYGTWAGPYPSGAKGTDQHTWTQIGNYQIRVKARDSWGAASGWSDPLAFSVIPNTPPTPPDIAGSSLCRCGKSYDYTFTSTDINDNQTVSYWVYWGDGNITWWTGPFNPGESMTLNHTWTVKGTYMITALAKDSAGNDSMGNSMTVKVPFKEALDVYHPGGFLQMLIERILAWFSNLRTLG